LAVYNGALYFGANANDGAGYELWKYDGTNITRAADIWVGGDSTPTFLAVYNGMLYFNANDGSGQKLWRYDGTTASRVPEPTGTNVSSPAFLTIYQNVLFFQANGNNGAGVELWRYNSTG
jgi:ELWxxDGT repeat protein